VLVEALAVAVLSAAVLALGAAAVSVDGAAAPVGVDADVGAAVVGVLSPGPLSTLATAAMGATEPGALTSRRVGCP